MSIALLFVDGRKVNGRVSIVEKHQPLIESCTRTAEKYNVQFEVINVRNGECELLKRHDVMKTPTLVLISYKGRITKRIGNLSESELDKLFKRIRGLNALSQHN